MKNTSILIPLILIGCLGALIYLFVTALNTTEEPYATAPPRTVATTPATTPPASSNTAAPATAPTYTEEPDPADPGQSTNLDDYYVSDEDMPDYGERAPVAPPTQDRAEEPAPARTLTRPTTTRRARYLVLAGSFTQLSGAEQRVRDLKAAGFPRARVGKMNGGNIAVAVADESNDLVDMQTVAQRVRAKNFEARIHDRE